MFTSVATSQFNLILRQESWPCKRLQPFEGRTVRVRIPPLIDLTLTVLENGELLHCPDQTEADATLFIPSALLPGLLARNETAYDKITISGDTVFANELIVIGKHIKPGIEQNLSGIMGDIPAHRIAQISGGIFQWHIKMARNLAETLGEYWQEEQPIIVKSNAVNNISHQIKTLQRDTDRLAGRINRIIQTTRTNKN
ncbi:ubiquinone biosynthesis protein UbiJ [Nitrosomonas sp. Nm51]|uniref:ubiquinone biosynthesis accessory factor UbiJ n=1 Tax=Nitrosomonas sp. Nm51 TaxID=133720 RepID=UPI0008CB23BB|nr:hypothetical protein [Nitrosomonas sp. Nm51]SER32867.1 ubiquinone biosynthesis protein UbiJ [Nitrosomonas sp. Nm51]